MDYVVVFDMAEHFWRFFLWKYSFLFFWLGFLAFWMVAFNKKGAQWSGGRPVGVRERVITSLVVAGVGLFVFTVWVNDLNQEMRLRELLQAGNCKVVEGKIEDYVPMPWGGHSDESFKVQGECFKYSDFNLTRAGLNNAASHGGPIKHSGQRVKIYHFKSRITKVEIAKEDL